MIYYQPPEQREFPDALLREQKEHLMSEITKVTTDKQTRSRRSRSLVLRVGIAGALAVVALIVVSITQIGDKGPLAPLAVEEAQAVELALDAITPVEGEVLHIKTSADLMAEYYLPGDSGPSGNSTDGTPRVEEIWSRSDSPWGWRWAMGGAGLELQEWAAYSTGRRLFYDSKTNSMLEVQDETLLSGEPRIPGEGYLTMIRRLLASGRAVEDGHEQIDGRDALRIVEKPAPEEGVHSENVYLVDAETSEPIEIRTADSTVHFVIYEKLPGTPENLALVDLKAAYPDATVYTDWKAYDLVVGPGPGLIAD
jgi:hypothetical protein